jgi:hypothetical protein
MKRCFMNDHSAILTVPAQAILTSGGTRLFQDYTNCIGEADWIMGRVRREKEHFAFLDRYVAECGIVDHLKKHRAFVLKKPFSCLVDMVVGSSIWPSNNLKSSAKRAVEWGSSERTMTVTSLL